MKRTQSSQIKYTVTLDVTPAEAERLNIELFRIRHCPNFVTYTVKVTPAETTLTFDIPKHTLDRVLTTLTFEQRHRVVAQVWSALQTVLRSSDLFTVETLAPESIYVDDENARTVQLSLYLSCLPPPRPDDPFSWHAFAQPDTQPTREVRAALVFANFVNFLFNV